MPSRYADMVKYCGDMDGNVVICDVTKSNVITNPGLSSFIGRTSIPEVKFNWTCEAHKEFGYFALKSKLGQCSDPNKTFTKADQQNAGCSETDTVDVCSKKLLSSCVEKELLDASSQWNTVEGGLRALERDAYDIGCKQQQEMALIPFDLILDPAFKRMLSWARGAVDYCQPVTFH